MKKPATAKRAANSSRSGKPAFGGEDGTEEDAKIEELPAWARTAEQPPSSSNADERMQGEANEESGGGPGKQADAASQASTQPAGETTLVPKPVQERESGSVEKTMGKDSHGEEAAQPVPETPVHVKPFAEESPASVEAPSLAPLRLFLEHDDTEPLPSPLPTVPVRPTGKSRSQAMVDAAVRMPRVPQVAIPREDSPPPEAADEKTIAARER